MLHPSQSWTATHAAGDLRGVNEQPKLQNFQVDCTFGARSLSMVGPHDDERTDAKPTKYQNYIARNWAEQLADFTSSCWWKLLATSDIMDSIGWLTVTNQSQKRRPWPGRLWQCQPRSFSAPSLQRSPQAAEACQRHQTKKCGKGWVFKTVSWLPTWGNSECTHVASLKRKAKT